MSESLLKLSVLLPVHNAERYVEAAVESVLTQTFREFELLALDDGSKDQSLAILQRFAMTDPRIRVLPRENRGLVASLNEMIGLARGPYLARMDSDDISLPKRFEEQVNYLDSHPDCVAIGSRSLIIDSDGLPIVETVNELSHEEIDSAHISGIGESRMCHPSVMMRRDALIKVGLYHDEFRFAEDLDLFLRLAEIGKLANLPEILLKYRQHLNSVCYTRADEQLAAAKSAVKAARIRRGNAFGFEELGLCTKAETSAAVHRKWAWWALSAGNVATARKHASLALIKNPFSVESVKAFACAIRGH